MCAERVLPSYDRQNRPVVMLDRNAVHASFEAAAAAADWLFEPAEAVNLAKVVNHFAEGMRYEVIEDPAAFAAEYRARRAAEDPDAPVDIHGRQLTKFAMPDLDRIEAPRLEDGRLVFYAVDATLGLPYRAEARVSPEGVERIGYEPLPPAPSAA